MLAAALSLQACARSRPIDGGTLPERRQSDALTTFDVAGFYRAAGLIAEPAPFAFVGNLHYFGTASIDTSLMLLALSIPSSALTFQRDETQFRAHYQVQGTVRRQGAGEPVGVFSAREEVRVGAFWETTRADESVIFQQIVHLPPGTYQLYLSVRDGGSARASSLEVPVVVPRLAPGRLSSAVPVYEVEPRMQPDSLPELITSPRATAALGRDSVIHVYVESYGEEEELSVLLRATGDRQRVLWQDSVLLRREGSVLSRIVDVPVARLGIGASSLTVTRADARDSTRTPLVVGYGDDLPMIAFDQMLEYLQFYTSPHRLRAMREATPEDRAEMWADFLRATDPAPNTTEHEGLRDYFRRVSYANQRFREDGGIGWRTDRGMVFVAFGEPDQVLEDMRGQMQRGRVQVWEYRDQRLRLTFVDQTGFGRWRMAPSSDAEFRNALARLRDR